MSAREQIAEALTEWFGMENPTAAADALMPLVDRLRAEAAAEAYEAAASKVAWEHGTASLAAKSLRDCAAALRTEAGA